MSIDECPRLPDALVARGRLLPDRDAILPLLPKGRTIVEVGVALGGFSRKLIDIAHPARFIAIDSFRIHDYPMFWGRPTQEIFGGRTHGDHYRAEFADMIASGRMQVLESDSGTALEGLADDSVDIFYVDADHTYAAVSRELSSIRRKVRNDGWIIMNDYTMADVVGQMEPYGVIHATNEFMLAEGREMTHLALQSYMYCDVVLRRLPPDRAAAFRAGHVEVPLRHAAPAVTPAVASNDQPIDTVAVLEQENAALRRDLAALRASTSWQLTSPLRTASRLLRGG